MVGEVQPQHRSAVVGEHRGVTGDLARKKLMPAVYDLANRGLLPPGFSLIGYARRDWGAQDFGQVVHDAVKQYSRTPFRESVWQQLTEGFRFVPGRASSVSRFVALETEPQDAVAPVVLGSDVFYGDRTLEGDARLRRVTITWDEPR